MKRVTMLFLAVTFFFTVKTQAQFFCEDFEYQAGDTISSHGWVPFSGIGTNEVVVVEPGLEHFCYGGIYGNAVQLNTTGEDSYKFLPSISNTGTVYLSFLVKFLNGQTGDFFFHLGDSSVNNSQKIARVYAKLAGGNIAMGLAKNNETPVYTGGNYTIGTTYLVVLKYEFFNGPDNDLVSLFIFDPNDCPPIVEPDATIGPLGSGENDLTNVGKIVLQQGAGSKSATLIIDGICMDRVWDNGALPVELTSFTSSVSQRDVTLNWSTSTETNNARFEIERKVAGTSDWNSTGSVDGNGTTNLRHEYSFTDRNLTSGRFMYRLKQIDYNGNYEYFNLSNEIQIGTPSEFELSQNFPNPFNPSTSINFGIPNDGFVSLKVYDNSGKEVATLVNESRPAGFYTVNFNALNLSSGVYFCSLQTNGFVKTMKMALMK